MGIFINPGNDGFENIRNGTYIDKTGLIALINQTLNTPDMLTCLTRPRRFGKSFAAKMLAAYYCCECESKRLFSDLEITRIPDADGGGLGRLGSYNVLYIDVSRFVTDQSDIRSTVKRIREAVLEELLKTWPSISEKKDLPTAMVQAAEISGKKFMAIIDEWDVIIREAKHQEEVKTDYLRMLRGLFKSSDLRDKIFSGAFITGILPIKKLKTGSALSDFCEYTMLRPGRFARYIGFTGDEVRKISKESHLEFEMMREWYDGYKLGEGLSIYNPASVMSAARERDYDVFWGESESYDELRQYIEMDFDSLQSSVKELMEGRPVQVRVRTFQNDLVEMKSADDVLTLLIHLGYLVYNRPDGTASIPNREVMSVFVETLRQGSHLYSSELIRRSDLLLEDTIRMKSDQVATAIQMIHDRECSPIFYNEEQALRSVIRLAYISCVDHYIKIEELPSGHGYADVVFFPRKESSYPVLIIELKWNKGPEGAVEQIKEKNYPLNVADYGAPVLLVGINYDAKSKEHACRIETAVL